jgi:hypothetical protein
MTRRPCPDIGISPHRAKDADASALRMGTRAQGHRQIISLGGILPSVGGNLIFSY